MTPLLDFLLRQSWDVQGAIYIIAVCVAGLGLFAAWVLIAALVEWTLGPISWPAIRVRGRWPTRREVRR